MSAASSIFLIAAIGVGLVIFSRKFPDPATAGADFQERLFGSRNFFGELFSGLFGKKQEGASNPNSNTDVLTPDTSLKDAVKPLANLGNVSSQNIVSRPEDGVKQVPLPTGIIKTDDPKPNQVSFPSDANVQAFSNGVVLSNVSPLLNLSDVDRKIAIEKLKQNRNKKNIGTTGLIQSRQNQDNLNKLFSLSGGLIGKRS